MRAIKTLFAAITGIQTAAGNSLPKLVAWVVLCGQLCVPVYCVVEKYIHQEQKTFAVSAIISIAVVLFSTASISIPVIPAGKLLSLKLKGALILFASTLLFAGIARLSPELSLAAYFLFAFLPLQKVLSVEVAKEVP